MTRPLPCSALLALGLIAAIPSSVTAQSLLARDPGCPLIALPDPERFCERLDRNPAPGGVAVLAGPRGASEMVESGPYARLKWILHTEDAHSLYRRLGFGEPTRKVMERLPSVGPSFGRSPGMRGIGPLPPS